jgi:hypothetical protein
LVQKEKMDAWVKEQEKKELEEEAYESE